MITKCKIQIARAPKVLIGIPQNFACEFSLAPEKKRISQTAIKALRFCIKFSSFKRSMLHFSKKTKFSNLPLEFCKSMQRLWRTSKKHLLAASHQHLVGTDFLRRCLLMSPKLATAQLPIVPQPCFQRWRLKTTGLVSPV